MLVFINYAYLLINLGTLSPLSAPVIGYINDNLQLLWETAFFLSIGMLQTGILLWLQT